VTIEERATAIHESGHAVACHTLGRPGSVVTIREGAAGASTAGGVGIDWGLSQSDIRGLNTRKVDDAVVILCAGPIAEGRFLGEDPIEFLKRPYSAVGKRGSALRALTGQANDWDLVLRIAQEITQIRGVSLITSVSHIHRKAIEARELIDEHWTEVEALSAVLLRRKTLTWDDVEGILAKDPE
jgi:ATP-dependent Zn protease